MSKTGGFSRKTAGILSLTGAFLYCAVLYNPMMTDEKGATDLLSKNQYTDIKIAGYGWNDCEKGDVWRTKFTAVNRDGQAVKGVVCEHLQKTPVIRVE